MIKRFLLFVRKKILHIDDRSMIEIAIENGLRLGKDVHIMDGCILDPGHCWLIEIGDKVTLAPRVHILAHDASTKRELGYTLIGRVSIGNNVFVGAGSIILPNVTIGDNVVIGAGSIVSRSIPSNSVAVGNPARVIGTYEDYINKQRRLMADVPLFDDSFIVDRITDEKKREMKDKLAESIGFIV